MPPRLWAAMSLSTLVGAVTAAEDLSELERAARADASVVRIAQEEASARRYRLDAAEAQQGGRFGAAAGLTDAREPVTDTLVRDYRRANAQAGVRWPLLDGAQALERAQTDARGALEVARLRARQAEDEALRALRLAYVDHLRSAERVALADGLLTLEPAARSMLEARTRPGFLLEADRRELHSIFEIARRDAVRARAQHDDALQRLRRLSARPQAAPALAPPRWDLGCIAAATPLLARAAERPAVALAAAELATREALAGQQQWTGVDAGVSITQGLTRDLGAASGRSTSVSVDVSVPFGWRGLRDARRAEAQSALRRARLELDAARETDAAAAEQALRELRVREADRAASAQRLAAAQEALRIAELRARRLDGDVLERLLKARHGVYVVAVEVSEGLQRLEHAQAEVLGFATVPCSTAPVALEPPQWPAVPSALARALPTQARAGVGWFAWQSAPWLAQPDKTLDQLPDGSDRVLLGFDAAQLRALATPAAAEALRALCARARERGVRIELLLGDPGWVVPGGRERLLGLLRPLADLPFDGLSLDLERSQLAPSAGRRWADGVVATLAAVHAELRWPIALVAHDRDLLDAALDRRLQAAGASELVAMVYVSDRDRAAARVRAVLRAAPEQRVSVAQSVERELAPSSSLHRLGLRAALAHVGELAHAMAGPADAPARFGGVLIQSFEAFRSAAP